MKRCHTCDTDKPLEAFARCAKHGDGLQTKCRECTAAYYRGYYVRNRERLIEYQLDYRAANRTAVLERERTFRAANVDRLRQWHRDYRAHNPNLFALRDRRRIRRRRALQAATCSAPFTEAQLAAKLAYWNDCCWVCGAPYEAVDHVKPLAAGGAHILANLRPICTSCNSRKRAEWPLPCRAWILGII